MTVTEKKQLNISTSNEKFNTLQNVIIVAVLRNVKTHKIQPLRRTLMSGIRTPSDKKETRTGCVRKSALKIHLKFLILRQDGIDAGGWLKGEGKTVATTATFFKFRKEQGEEYGKWKCATENWPFECKNMRLIIPCYLWALQSVHLRKMQIFIRQCLTGQREGLHSQLQFSEVELCGTKPVVHGSPQIVTTEHLNISRNFTAN
jgi:hypothetical protein